MDAVALDHVDKTYTTYGTDIVLTGETRPSRTRQVLRDPVADHSCRRDHRDRGTQRLRQEHAAEAAGGDGDA